MNINVIDLNKLDLNDNNIIQITALLHDSHCYEKEFQKELIDLFRRYKEIKIEIQNAREKGRIQYQKRK